MIRRNLPRGSASHVSTMINSNFRKHWKSGRKAQKEDCEEHPHMVEDFWKARRNVKFRGIAGNTHRDGKERLGGIYQGV